MPAACVAGAATLLVGAVCLADVFILPALFGALAAMVVAAERLLCAARSSLIRFAAAWTLIAMGWIAVASCLLHPPWAGAQALPWITSALILFGVALRWRIHRTPTVTAAIASWVATLGAAGQLGLLLGPLSITAAMPVARIAAATATELVLIGLVRLLDAGCLHRGAHLSVLPNTPERVTATAGVPHLEPGIA